MCSFCGEQFPTARLTAHIVKQHPRPKQRMAPRLVRKPVPVKTAAAK